MRQPSPRRQTIEWILVLGLLGLAAIWVPQSEFPSLTIAGLTIVVQGAARWHLLRHPENKA